ncbi:MAG TPA: helix-turn-helix domain-containing protein [Planctomycetota bacterium]|nr:helix-turn-helix domain-containing protein [Planctomycetota bacterium]
MDPEEFLHLRKTLSLEEIYPLHDEMTAKREPSTFPRYEQALGLAGLEAWLQGLQVSFVSATDWFCTPKWQLGPRVVPDSMFFLFEEGHGSGAVENEKFEIRAGDIMLIPQGASHWVRQDPGTTMRLSSVHFHAHVFGGINLLDLLGFPVHIRPQLPRDQLLHDIPRQLDRDEIRRPPGHTQYSAAAMTIWLLHLVRHFGPTFKPPYTSERIHELRRLLPAFDHLERNLGDSSLSISALSKRVFVSEVQFRKLFRRVTGKSPVRYIQQRRVQRACRLLRETTGSLDEIARDAGFNDAPFFCRVFKTWTKTTPAQYRMGKGE